MKIFLTGGTGFVGSEIVKQLLARDHRIVALVRPGSENKLAESDAVKIHLGDLAEPESLPAGLDGCDAVIHLVGIIRDFPDKGVTFEKVHVEGTRHVLEAAAAQGIRRFLHMSANGADREGPTAYQKTKWQAEQAVGKTELDWTIFRPSLIFGPGGEFVEMLGEMVRRLPVVPVIGDGQYRLQPVSVDQVAATYVKALDLPETAGRTYHLAGAESYTYDEILDLTGKALGKDSVHKLHQPVAMVKPIVKALESFEKFPLSEAQMSMLLEGNECDPGPWAEDFKIEPVAFAQGIGKCFEAEGDR